MEMRERENMQRRGVEGQEKGGGEPARNFVQLVKIH